MRIVLYNPDRCAGAAVITYVWLLAPGSLGVSVRGWISSVAHLFQLCSHDAMMGWIETCCSACINLQPKSGGKKINKKEAKQKASAVTQNCQMTVALRPKTGGNYTRGEKNLLAEVINRKLSIHIHKAATNLREWHQFPKGQPPLLCLLLNTKETCIYQVRTLMRDGFRSATHPPSDCCMGPPSSSAVSFA